MTNTHSGRRRVAVTGIGLVSPLGVGTELTWEGLMSGRSGVGPITRIDPEPYTCRIAGEVPDFDPELYFDKKEARRADAFIQYAVAASQLAIDDAGYVITPENAEHVAVLIGAGIGGLPLIETMHKVLLEKGPSRVTARRARTRRRAPPAPPGCTPSGTPSV